MTMTDRATVVGIFTTRELAEQAMEELHRQGFSHDDIGFITRDYQNVAGVDNAETEEEDATSRIAAGATGGGVIGGILGAAASLLIPGLGLVTAAGVMAATLTGLLAGSITGGMIGALTSLGLPEEEARYYESAVSAGHTLVTVNAPGRQQDASALLLAAGAIDTRARSTLDATRPVSQPEGETPHLVQQDQKEYPITSTSVPPITSEHTDSVPYEEHTAPPTSPVVRQQRETMGSEVHTETPTTTSGQAPDPSRPAYQNGNASTSPQAAPPYNRQGTANQQMQQATQSGNASYQQPLAGTQRPPYDPTVPPQQAKNPDAYEQQHTAEDQKQKYEQ